MSAKIILVDPGFTHVWLGSKLDLPQAILPAHPAEVAIVVQTIAQLAGQPGAVLACLNFERGREACYLCASLSPYEHNNPNWYPLQQLPGEYLESINQWLMAATPQRNPWTKPSWHQELAETLREKLSALGYSLTGKPVQHRTWSISCILKVPVLNETLYVKGLPPVFQHEAYLIQWLEKLAPHRVPQVVLAEQGWFVSRDFQGFNLGEVEDMSVWQAAIAEYARLQIKTIGRDSQLLGLGCRDRRLPELLKHSEELACFLGEVGQQELADAWRRIMPKLKIMAQELEQGGIPYCLEHGDLHCGNIQVTDNGFIFFDWTDGCLAHPFFSLDPFLAEAPQKPTIRRQLIDAYLAEWQMLLPSIDLEKALRPALKLALAHQTYSYYLIYQAVEPAIRPELGGAVPALTRKTIQALEEEV